MDLILSDETSKEFKEKVKKVRNYSLEKAEVVLQVERLKSAFNRLKEAVERVKNDLDRDGAIQWSLLWSSSGKLLNKF